MTRSFDIVDGKILEADFFLDKLATSGFSFFEARCYFSAFVAASRSITFSLQAVMTHVDGFLQWYATKQELLKQDSVARFFNRVRVESQHIGVTPLNSGASGVGEDGQPFVLYYFSAGIGETIPDVPNMDAVSACRRYLELLVEIVFDCYDTFGAYIDPYQYYTVDNLKQLGLSIEDIEESLGFPRGWTDVASGQEEERLRSLRQSIPDSEIDAMFRKYLNRSRWSNEG